MKKAKVGSKIEFFGGYQGTVEMVRENSVIVRITHNAGQSYKQNVTVVNHKKYKVLSK